MCVSHSAEAVAQAGTRRESQAIGQFQGVKRLAKSAALSGRCWRDLSLKSRTANDSDQSEADVSRSSLERLLGQSLALLAFDGGT